MSDTTLWVLKVVGCFLISGGIIGAIWAGESYMARKDKDHPNNDRW